MVFVINMLFHVGDKMGWNIKSEASTNAQLYLTVLTLNLIYPCVYFNSYTFNWHCKD